MHRSLHITGHLPRERTTLHALRQSIRMGDRTLQTKSTTYYVNVFARRTWENVALTFAFPQFSECMLVSQLFTMNRPKTVVSLGLSALRPSTKNPRYVSAAVRPQIRSVSKSPARTESPLPIFLPWADRMLIVYGAAVVWALMPRCLGVIVTHAEYGAPLTWARTAVIAAISSRILVKLPIWDCIFGGFCGGEIEWIILVFAIEYLFAQPMSSIYNWPTITNDMAT